MKNSIGKDIILLKDFTEGNLKRDKLENYKGSYKMGYFYCKDIQQAIEHILSDYKRVLKENEELKEERQIVGIPVKNKRDGRIGIVLHQWESGSVAVLESINPRVINTHDSWNTLEIVTDEVKQTQTKCETIPVQIIEDFIKKYQKLSDEFYEKFLETNRTDKDLHDAGLACDAKVDVLKKVLKEGKEFDKAAEEIDKYCENGGEKNDKSNKK